MMERRFARWDKGAWERFSSGPLVRFAGRSPATADSFCELAAEALGRGHLRGGTLFEHVWTRLLPEERGVAAATLASAWNVCESFVPLAPWLHRYVIAGARACASLEADVATALRSALGARAPATFAGPFALRTIPPADEDFLPGELHFVAPAVLCVHDRLAPGVHHAFEVAPAPRFLGVGDCLGATLTAPVPTVQLGDRALTIGGRNVVMPRFESPGAPAVSPAGLVVLAIVDSQRLTVVSSP